MAQKIGQVVAPPAEDGDSEEEDEDYDDEGGYYEEDEEGEYYSEEEEEESEEHQQKPKGSPFGLVGLLARAMDSEQHDYDESHANEEEAGGGGGGSHAPALMIPDEEEEVDFQQDEEEEQQQEPELHPHQPEKETTVPAATREEEQATPTLLDRNSSMGSSILSGTGSELQHHQHRHDPPAVSSSFKAKLDQADDERRRAAARYDSANMSNLSAAERESEHDPEPARFSLVRESGSLSPQRSSSPHKAKTSSPLKDRLQAAGAPAALPLSESRNESSEDLKLNALGDGDDDDDNQEQEKTESSPEAPKAPAQKQRDALLGSLSDAKLQPLQPYASGHSFDDNAASEDEKNKKATVLPVAKARDGVAEQHRRNPPHPRGLDDWIR